MFDLDQCSRLFVALYSKVQVSRIGVLFNLLARTCVGTRASRFLSAAGFLLLLCGLFVRVFQIFADFVNVAWNFDFAPNLFDFSVFVDKKS